jgi:hypothetical protein
VSLFRSSLRPPAIVSDEAVARYLASIRAELDPDPAFKRRLRGVVVNRFVAARELGVRALGEGLEPTKAMGRLGRAVLYASFAIGVGVTGAMAASEAAVPGDVLYPLKRAIEDARLQVLPDDFHDVLIAHELTERLSELALLVDRGDDVRVAGLATEIAAQLEPPRADDPSRTAAAIEENRALLATLIGRLPDEAQLAVTAALSTAVDLGASGVDPGSAGADGDAPGAASSGPGNGSSGSGNGGTGTGSGGSSSGNGGSGSANGGSGSGNGDSGNGGSGNGNTDGPPDDAPGADRGGGTGDAGSGAGTTDDDSDADQPDDESTDGAGASAAPTLDPGSGETPEPAPKARKSPKP